MGRRSRKSNANGRPKSYHLKFKTLFLTPHSASRLLGEQADGDCRALPRAAHDFHLHHVVELVLVEDAVEVVLAPTFSPSIAVMMSPMTRSPS